MTIEDKVKKFRQWLDEKRKIFLDTQCYDDATLLECIISMYNDVFYCENKKEEPVTMKKLRKIVRTCTINSYRDLLSAKQGTDKEKGSKLLYNLFVYIDKALTAETKENDKKRDNTVWNSENVAPKYNLNGITDLIVSSAYGHIEGEAHTYTPEQWSAHIGFNQNREFRWAYEKDLINFDY